MLLRKITLTLLLGHLLIAGVASVCIPIQCQSCNFTNGCTNCTEYSNMCNNESLSSHCRTEFNVLINNTDVNVNEGETINLICVNNLPNVIMTTEWKKDGKIIPSENKNNYVHKVFKTDSGFYSCFVNSSCGVYESPPCVVTVENQSLIILVICGVAALVLVLIMGLAMKFKLKRDNDKHRERRQQRAQFGQGGCPAPFTPRES